jgi:hypothetical protein
VESKRDRIRRVKYWKTAPALLAAVSASLALAEDFKTINGKEYKNVTVTRVEPDGIVLKTKSGIAKVYFIELPKDAQERFGYDVQRRKQQETPLATPAVVSSATPVPHVDFSAAPTKWAYSEHQDEMGRGTTKVAQVVSSNTVHFGFPYQGETHAVLQLRNSPKYGQDVMVRVERGQFVSSYTKNFVTVRFDDGELWKFDIGEPEDGATGLLFMRPVDAESFIDELRKAKRLRIEADFFREGPRVFEFDVRGLDW